MFGFDDLFRFRFRFRFRIRSRSRFRFRKFPLNPPTLFDCMFDMKGWLKPHLELLNNHSHPHIFWLRKGPGGHMQLYANKWIHNEWKPQTNPRCHGVCIITIAVSALVRPDEAKVYTLLTWKPTY